jgi:hypothetical protein
MVANLSKTWLFRSFQISQETNRKRASNTTWKTYKGNAPLHCRGGWLGRPPGWPDHQPPLQQTTVGAAGDPAVPTVVCSYKCHSHPSSSPSHSLQLVKKGLGGLGHLPKIALVGGEVFNSNSMVGSLFKVRECHSHPLIQVLLVG